MTEYCENCRFWNGFEGEGEKSKEGWCRRYPPVLRCPDPASDDVNDTNWFPTTRDYDWCGEYVRREEPKE